MEENFKGTRGISGVVFSAMELGDVIREQTLEEDGFVMDDNYFYKATGNDIHRFKCLGNGYCIYDCTFKTKGNPRLPMGEYL